MRARDVGEPGELVGHRLALDRLVEARVLDRDHRLAGEVLEQLLLLARELRVAARDRDRAEVLGPAHGERIGTDSPNARPALACTGASAPSAAPPGRALEQLRPHLRPHRERGALGQLERRHQVAHERADVVIGKHAPIERHRAAGVGLAGVHRLAHRERDHAVAVEARGQRVADPADRLGELLALSLDLLDLRLELARHAVELATELRELVPALRPARAGGSPRAPGAGRRSGRCGSVR